MEKIMFKKIRNFFYAFVIFAPKMYLKILKYSVRTGRGYGADTLEEIRKTQREIWGIKRNVVTHFKEIQN